MADAESLRFFQHRATERNIGSRQAAVPEQAGLAIGLAPANDAAAKAAIATGGVIIDIRPK